MEYGEPLEEWVDRYVDRLTHFAYTYVRDWATAEDVVQETFIKAYLSKDKLENIGHPLSWLIRIVINECRDRHRRTWREVVTSLVPDWKVQSAEEVYLESVRSSEVHTAVLSLPVSYRTPVVLFYFEELSTDEIACILGTKSATVRTRIARGRKRLETILKRGEKNEYRRSNSEGKASV